MDRYQESSLYFLSLNCSWNFAKRIHPSMQSRTYFRYPTSCHCSHACSSWDSTRKYLQHPLAEIERDCRWADHTIPTSTAPPNSTHKHTHTQNTEGAQLLEREGGRESRGDRWGVNELHTAICAAVIRRGEVSSEKSCASVKGLWRVWDWQGREWERRKGGKERLLKAPTPGSRWRDSRPDFWQRWTRGPADSGCLRVATWAGVGGSFQFPMPSDKYSNNIIYIYVCIYRLYMQVTYPMDEIQHIIGSGKWYIYFWNIKNF